MIIETVDKIESKAKRIIVEIFREIQMYGFWCIILISIGIFIGISYYNKTKANDTALSIKLGGFVYDNKVYDIKIRQIQ